ncbi:MAG: GatB/YqeY domain-containing protein [Calditrichaeota bacterium]|nr:GatB/YqeY domain-containing protein [Calditrichota bacterium]MCB0296073.1 GatB/YqeY domain-containing protein [Calditrichota bacterium]MCB0307426.1 GatB/YqeY domain-containing protein [Calditrichota bacterium]MCB0313732.1 GatB/YqeY domain-containing protein [Calditrichota bacterium]
MGLLEKLTEDMKAAMKAGDKLLLETVRSLRGDIKNAQIEKGAELDDEEILQVIARAAKKRRDAIAEYRKYGREDKAEAEQAELTVIDTYLPEQLGREEIEKVVLETIAQVNAASMSDFGKVMGAVMPKLKGKADGSMVQQVVRAKLSEL